MNIIDSIPFIGEDTRKRKFLLPESIVKVGGLVEAPERLLVKKTMQIGLGETDFSVLKNEGDGENAYVLLDFGREMHGGIRLLAFFTSGEGYPEMKITFGESISEAMTDIGEKGASNDHAARQFTIPVPLLSDQEWGQTGFRYVRLELVTPNSSVMLKSALGVFVYRDYEYKGSFRCNDENVNRIYETAAYTCHLNLQNMVWDGIKRDRLVWIGDMMPECLTIRDLFGSLEIVEESLDFAKEQTPLPGWIAGMPTYSVWWLMIVWEWYITSGNDAFLLAQKDYALKLIDIIASLVKEDGDDTLPSYFLDWPTDDNPAKKSGVRCLIRMALERGALLAAYYGDGELEKRCLERREWIDRMEETVGDEKQIIAFMSLAGVMDAVEAANRIEKDGVKGFSTFLLYYILSAIAEGNGVDRALPLMKEYLNLMLDKGATTFFEDFNSDWAENSSLITDFPHEGQKDIHGDFGAFCYVGFRHSLCHGWASGAVPFLTEYVLGVKIAKEGCRSLVIKPDLGPLEWAEGTFPTPYGEVKISHKKLPDGTVESRTNAPDEVEIILK